MSHQLVDLTSNHNPWCPSSFLLFYFSPQGFQFGSVPQSSPTLCYRMDFAANQASLFTTNSWSLLKLMSIESVIPPNHLILCHPLLLPPSIFPNIGVFSNESLLCIRWPKYWIILGLIKIYYFMKQAVIWFLILRKISRPWQ